MTSGEQRLAALLCVLLGLGVLAARHRADPPRSPPSAAAQAFVKAERRAVHAVDRPAEPPGPINVNQATPQALQTLPGIGPALSARIVAYREAHGPFHSVGALRHVSGVGPRTVARLRPLVTVQAPTPGEAVGAFEGAAAGTGR